MLGAQFGRRCHLSPRSLPYFTGAHGFPLLSGAGRLVIKDIIMSAGGLLVAAEAARRFMAQRAA